jgi:hypothetical protein
MTMRFAALPLLLLLCCATAGAQQAGAETDATSFFHWYTADSPDWAAGALYAVLGVIGALFVGYSTLGGALPGSPVQARLDLDEQRLTDLQARINELAKASPVDSEAIEALTAATTELRRSVTTERYRQYSLGLLFYIVLGAFFASALARDLVQAVVIGAGWTGLVGTFGLKQDFAARKFVKDAALEDAQKLLDSTPPADQHRSLGPDISAESVVPADLARMRSDIRVARRL